MSEPRCLMSAPGSMLWLPQVAQLSRDQFRKLWRQVVTACADCLLAANDDPDSPAGKRLVRSCLSTL